MQLTASVKLPNLTANSKPLKTSAEKSVSSSSSAKVKTSAASASGGHQAKPFGSKLETKVLEGTGDDAYSSEDESDDDRRGGRKINHLKECRDLMLSFDGGKLGKKKFYSIHATTPNRQSFCLDLDDVTRLSQTGDYIYELLKKVHCPPLGFIVRSDRDCFTVVG
jgi:hypothetical protein